MAYTNIDDPSAHFQTALWAGNSSTQTITNDGNSDLQPDWVWLKSRTTTNVHLSQDSTIGATGGVYRYLQPDNTAAEAVQTDGDGITSLNSDGFSLGYGNSNSWNSTGKNYVAWQWKANGGTTSSNTDGNITSTVQSNQDAGFSLVTYTGNGSNNQTIGHGLGVQPSWWIVKRRDSTGDWWFGASSILGGTSNYLKLNSTAGNAEINNIWGDSPTSSTLFRVSNNAGLNASGGTYVAYLFANKQGYSKFGKYIGNGSNTNGAFIYTGFKPAMIIVKRTDANAHNWFIWDTKRAPSNMVEAVLYPNATSSEGTLFQIDILSNGFKHYNNYGSTNVSGGTFIYMAFAENPFTTSTGIPTTAR